MMSEKNKSAFSAILRNIYESLESGQFQNALALCNLEEQMSEDEIIQIKSLKGYVFLNLSMYQQAEGLLQQCLTKKPLHLASQKRKAVLLEKKGFLVEAQDHYEFALLLQPESRSLKNKLKKIKMKSHSSTKSESSSDNNTISSKDQQEKQNKKPEVKFGSFEIIDITKADSDQHSAIIKQQISKLSEKKPKKSILKQPMSTSIFSDKKKNLSEKLEMEEVKNLQENWFRDEILIKQKKSQSFIQIKKEKKCKSVSFGDNDKYDYITDDLNQ